MRPTEKLIREHDAILTMLKILDRAVGASNSGDGTKVNDLRKMVDFLSGFADGCHHAKEEGYLFPALEQAGIPREHGPIGVMLAEHDLGRKYVKGMHEALDGAQRGEKFSQHRLAFTMNARAYANLLKAHIEKENNVLFPMADVALTEERQLELSKAFERLEAEKIGAESHEALYAVLRDLCGTYLSKAHPSAPDIQD